MASTKDLKYYVEKKYLWDAIRRLDYYVTSNPADVPELRKTAALLNEYLETYYVPTEQRRRELGLMNLVEMAKEIGICKSTLWADVARGVSPKPNHKLAGRKKMYYGPDDVEPLKAFYARFQRGAAARADERRPTHWSLKDVAKAVGISHTAVYHHIHCDRIPAPTHQIDRRPGYYTVEEAKVVVDKLRDIVMANGVVVPRRSGEKILD